MYTLCHKVYDDRKTNLLAHKILKFQDLFHNNPRLDTLCSIGGLKSFLGT